MGYVGKKPADIIATAVDTTTGTFSGDLTVDTSTLYVDSANNRVGIGTSSPNFPLDVVSDSSANGIQLRGRSADNIGQLNFESNDSGTAYSQFQSRSTELFIKTLINIPMSFYTNNLERMRIDGSGNVLVGKTATNFGTAGIELNQNNVAGKSFFARSGGEPISLNRLSSDGDILTFYKDSSLVGSIGARSGNLQIGTDDVGLEFHDTDNTIYPANVTTQALPDNTISFGSASSRFKDLYLSNSAQLANITNGAGEKIILNSDNIAFQVQASEAMRIDSSGNLLVGGTETVVYADTSGNQLEYGSYFALKRETANSSQAVAYFNNTGSDGNIIDLRKDGTTVGSIGTLSSKLTIGSSGTGVRFNYAGLDAIVPWNVSTNALTDGATSLGYASTRFNNLYLSGGVYLGGTGSANYLDDYEEGSWTPTFRNDGSTTYQIQYGRYVKIGQLVMAAVHLDVATNNIGTNAIQIETLPFTSINDNANAYGSSSSLHCNNWNSSNKPDHFIISANSTYATGYGSVGQSGLTFPNGNDLGGGNLIVTLIYRTSS